MLMIFCTGAAGDILDNTLYTGDNLFKTGPLLVLGAGASGAFTASLFERGRDYSGFLQGNTFAAMDKADDLLFGELYPVAVTGVWLTGIAAGDQSVEQTGEDLIRGLFYTYGITVCTKYAFQRERPDGSDSLSFPSWHAAGAACTAAVLWSDHGPGTGIPAAIIALYTCLSRINLQRHFPSDVIMGAAIGTACGIAASGVDKDDEDRRATVFSLSFSLDSAGKVLQSLWQ